MVEKPIEKKTLSIKEKKKTNKKKKVIRSRKLPTVDSVILKILDIAKESGSPFKASIKLQAYTKAAELILKKEAMLPKEDEKNVIDKINAANKTVLDALAERRVAIRALPVLREEEEKDDDNAGQI